jgi:hypothetical protein
MDALGRDELAAGRSIEVHVILDELPARSMLTTISSHLILSKNHNTNDKQKNTCPH